MGKRIQNAEALAALQERAKQDMDIRNGPKEMQVIIHMGTCGIAAGARDVLATIVAEMQECGSDKATLRQSGCAGLCDREPMLTVTDKSGQMFRYGRLDPKKVRRIVREHIIAGEPVMDFLIVE